VFPEFGRQDEFPSFLKISFGKDGTTKSLLTQTQTPQDNENSTQAAF